MSDAAAPEEGASTSKAADSQSKPPRQFKFPAHQDHTLSLAKMCKESKQFADCVIQSDSGFKHRAHRLVLGAASGFLKTIFEQVPPSLPEATVLVPGVKESTVKALLDFLYTGEMSVEREDTADLQLLTETLQINPNLITVDEVEEGDHEKEEEEDKAKNRGPRTDDASPESDVKAASDPDVKAAGVKRKVEDDSGHSRKEGDEIDLKRAKRSPEASP